MVHHLKDGNVHGAGDGAMPASHAKIYPKTLLVVNEFMHGSLPPAAVLGRAGVMAPCFQCEIRVVAGIIALVAQACIPDLLVGDLETMAGRADECTGVAAYAIA